jgi:hypothetical protein
MRGACLLVNMGREGEGEELNGGFTVFAPNRYRMLVSGNGCFFKWYFTCPRSFNGIFQKHDSFDAIEPIFPYLIRLLFLPNSFSRTNEHTHTEYLPTTVRGFYDYHITLKQIELIHKIFYTHRMVRINRRL